MKIHNPSYPHSLELNINFTALEYNVNILRKMLNDEGELMPVIKSDAYGSGVIPIATKLQDIGIKHFAVAIIEEGIYLREAGIESNILVLYADKYTVEAAIRYDLDVEIYSLSFLRQVESIAEANRQVINIHLKFDTGMHRLGMLPEELKEALHICKNCRYLNVTGFMSHLASSEDKNDDDFTHGQIALFDQLYAEAVIALGYSPKRHIQNSGAILRHRLPYEISRVGIALYGVSIYPEMPPMKKVHTFTGRIIQVKKVKAGDSVSYNRNTTLERDSLIGIVNVGYADGLIRGAGNRRVQVMVKDQMVDIIGNVCMDCIIVDLTDTSDVEEYDPVEIFGENVPVEKLARKVGSIPYEVLCGISNRVKRTYFRS